VAPFDRALTPAARGSFARRLGQIQDGLLGLLC
jgi:hypothetical protein